MTFRVRKPYSNFVEALERQTTIQINDKSTGLYMLRLQKNMGVDSIDTIRVKHNNWILTKTKPIHKIKDLQKYAVFE